jgi:hypothetical protein
MAYWVFLALKRAVWYGNNSWTGRAWLCRGSSLPWNSFGNSWAGIGKWDSTEHWAILAGKWTILYCNSRTGRQVSQYCLSHFGGKMGGRENTGIDSWRGREVSQYWLSHFGGKKDGLDWQLIDRYRQVSQYWAILAGKMKVCYGNSYSCTGAGSALQWNSSGNTWTGRQESQYWAILAGKSTV